MFSGLESEQQDRKQRKKVWLHFPVEQKLCLHEELLICFPSFYLTKAGGLIHHISAPDPAKNKLVFVSAVSVCEEARPESI